MKKSLVMILFSFSSAFAAESPELPSAYEQKPLISSKQAMVVTNNRFASQAAQQLLLAGGNAIDAAIAAGFVLGLTEPQSSGIGGGGYALTYMANRKKLVAYDGREVAPMRVEPNWFLNQNGVPLSFKEAVLSAKSIGVPGEVALFYQLHQQSGHLAWRRLLLPAIDLARRGFPMSPRLYKMLVADAAILKVNPEIRQTYFLHDRVKPVGSIIKNPAYADTLDLLANNPQTFYRGRLAAAIIQVINEHAHEKIYTKKDFSRYTVKTYPALCQNYRDNYRICSVPSSSGGVALLELLGLYAHSNNITDAADPAWVYFFLQASKLAYADRNQYLADPDFVRLPIVGLLSTDYLQQRSRLIKQFALVAPVAAGSPAGVDKQYAPDVSVKLPGTTSLTIVDHEGNAITMTLTIESQFGSHLFTHGFFLNNELTDFSFVQKTAKGALVANRIQPGKRPRSSIAPVMVFNKKNELYALSGSPGGSEIICYVAKNLILMLDMHLLPDRASAAVNMCASHADSVVESMISFAQKTELEKRHEVFTYVDLVSGATNILKNPDSGWYGSADPRREGVALGVAEKQ